jgi:hypothetical protein
MLAKCATIFIASISLGNPVLRRRIEICLATHAAKDEYEIMVVGVVIVECNMDLNAWKGALLYFASLARLFLISVTQINIAHEIRLDVNLILFYPDFKNL